MEQIIIGGVAINGKEAIERYKERKSTAHITARQAEIFEEKFGINGKEKTYAEVGSKFGISRERVRQLCAKVLYEIGFPI